MATPTIREASPSRGSAGRGVVTNLVTREVVIGGVIAGAMGARGFSLPATVAASVAFQLTGAALAGAFPGDVPSRELTWLNVLSDTAALLAGWYAGRTAFPPPAPRPLPARR